MAFAGWFHPATAPTTFIFPPCCTSDRLPPCTEQLCIYASCVSEPPDAGRLRLEALAQTNSSPVGIRVKSQRVAGENQTGDGFEPIPGSEPSVENTHVRVTLARCSPGYVQCRASIGAITPGWCGTGVYCDLIFHRVPDSRRLETCA